MNDNQKRKRHPFTPEEDKKLRELVDLYGEQNWSIISSHMINRSIRQCRDRWTNSLSGNVVKGEWSAEEDALLLRLFKENGSRWKSMEKFFPGRAQYDIRNHCKSIVNQKLYAFNFFNHNKIITSSLKNKAKNIQAAKRSPLQNIPVPNLNLSQNIENNNNINFQSQHNEVLMHSNIGSEKDFSSNFLPNNNFTIPHLSNRKESREQLLEIDDNKNFIDNTANGKLFINLKKIDPILVPFISEPMLLQISSS